MPEPDAWPYLKAEIPLKDLNMTSLPLTRTNTTQLNLVIIFNEIDLKINHLFQK